MVALFLVGLSDTALREARDRMRSAIVNSGEQWPSQSGFDLGIAVAILAAAEAIPAGGLKGVVFIGELGLDGRYPA